jgi:hypothetical protein
MTVTDPIQYMHASIDAGDHWYFAMLKAMSRWDQAEEVTFECEPGTLTEQKLTAIREIGVTRLSLGVATFIFVPLVGVVVLLLVFALDQSTGSAPVQHLYYLPIIFSAIEFGTPGGLAAPFTAIAATAERPDYADHAAVYEHQCSIPESGGAVSEHQCLRLRCVQTFGAAGGGRCTGRAGGAGGGAGRLSGIGRVSRRSTIGQRGSRFSANSADQDRSSSAPEHSFASSARRTRSRARRARPASSTEMVAAPSPSARSSAFSTRYEAHDSAIVHGE